MGRVADKLFLFLYSVAILIFSGIGLIVSMEWVAPAFAESFVDAIYMTGPAKYAAIAVCAALFLLSIRFLFVSLRKSRERSGSIDQRTEFGDIRISLETVENLALKAANRVRGVKDLRARVRVDDSGLDIQLRSVVDGESSIQQLTEEMQRGVKEHVEDITGIPVATVTVYVANVVQSQTFKARVE
ncbi:alkaline shock response membrane anchor protein AmaP [Paenibacillus antri]|uniref:Alkaline shock response membrane anchor protein AmaP n=1 Tax=Paenibacillus antri TaxID=2582848 RepID=A0A5R9GD22_9BACL|nr:alkaline shock response membrane anchor protein AmaP [Paenibacillus antri]TLS52999.1 alkaline shock response membrane anchor protein AmaP [Paenibacillus antri]